jgi:hypothetical protein
MSTYSRQQYAETAHDQFDLHARLRGFDQRFTNASILKLIHLGEDWFTCTIVAGGKPLNEVLLAAE